MRIIIFFLMFFCRYLTLGQELFQFSLGGQSDEYGSSFYQNNKSYVLAGGTYSFGAGISDVFITEIDKNANILWSKTYGGDNYDHSYSFQKTSDNGYISVGTTYSYGIGICDGFIIKVDSIGNLNWTKTIGGLSNTYINYVNETTNNQYLTCGTTNVSNSQTFDAFICLLDNNGDTLKTLIFDAGGTEDAYEIKQTDDGGFLIVGSSELGGNYDVMIMKLSNNLSIEWSKKFGGIDYEHGYSIAKSTNSTWIVCGETTSSGAGDKDILVFKIDENGSLIWSKTYGGQNYDIGYDIICDMDGKSTIIGKTESSGFGSTDGYILLIDNNGDILSSKAYGGVEYDELWQVQRTNTGELITIGATWSFGNGAWDVYFAKLDSVGNAKCNYVDINFLQSNATIIENTINMNVFQGFLTTTPNLFINDIFGVNLECSNVGLIENLNSNEVQIERIVDLFGRDTNIEYNKMLIYIYNNGTTKKVFIEE